MADQSSAKRPHFTARRGFITAAGFGVVSLYGLWAAYGAAPLRLLVAGDHDAAAEHGGGHAEHGAPGSPAAEEFRRLIEEFVAANKLPDGSVQPVRRRPAAAAATTRETAPHSAEHGHEVAQPAAADARTETASEAVDVYLMAYLWGYTPAVLRLARDVPYRFRMMAVDVTHGASLRIGNASRIVRLRAGMLVEQELRFTRAGEYLLYCTTYCGMLHDHMQGRIIVT